MRNLPRPNDIQPGKNGVGAPLPEISNILRRAIFLNNSIPAREGCNNPHPQTLHTANGNINVSTPVERCALIRFIIIKKYSFGMVHKLRAWIHAANGLAPVMHSLEYVLLRILFSSLRVKDAIANADIPKRFLRVVFQCDFIALTGNIFRMVSIVLKPQLLIGFSEISSDNEWVQQKLVMDILPICLGKGLLSNLKNPAVGSLNQNRFIRNVIIQKQSFDAATVHIPENTVFLAGESAMKKKHDSDKKGFCT